MNETHVVICFLRSRGEVLLFRRDEDAGPCSRRWSAVAGHATDDPDAAVREALAERGLRNVVSLVRVGDPFDVEDPSRETRRTVHPYLFDCESRAVETNHETTEFEWASPTEIRRRGTVPGLWRAYECIAPTVDVVREDTEHGSAWLSVRALEVLRDRAGVLTTPNHDGNTDDPGVSDGREGWRDLSVLARDLRTARPSMPVIENRVNRVMTTASDDRTPEVVEDAARRGIERAFAVDEAAASEAASHLDGTVLTLSRSGTVLDTLRRADVEGVVVCESRPAREGVGVAETLADETRVTLAVDAAAAHLLAECAIDAVLVGADTVFPAGSVSNKVGTRGIALAAAHENVPVYAVAASDKVSVDSDVPIETGGSMEIYDGGADIEVLNPTFDRTPPAFVTVVTERGPLDVEGIETVAEELRALAAWSQEPSPDTR